MRELLMLLLLAGATAGCCAKKADAQEPAPAPVAAAEPPPAEPPPAEPAEPPPADPRLADPLQNPDSTGSSECDEYLATFDHIVATCADKLGPALDAMKQSRDAQREAFRSWDTMKPEEREANIEAAATGCKAATDALKQASVSMGCP